MLGERFGSYKAVVKLGAGTMGEVYLGEHQRINRRAAIKVLMPALTQDPEAVRGFFTEASATSLIQHPGIVEIFDCDVHRRGWAYIVMEYLAGETLRARLERGGPLPCRVACQIAAEIADAIGAAHDKGIVHRDLKPENVFLVAGAGAPAAFSVKVLDFGIAKLLSNDAAGVPHARVGVPVGSPAYMSPEQWSGQAVDHRADLYSLGCVLFEMISGVPPFGGRRVHELMAAHRFRPAPRLSQLAQQVPAWLGVLVAQLLAKDPALRPQAMRDVAAVLRGHRGARMRLPELPRAPRWRARPGRYGAAVCGAVLLAALLMILALRPVRWVSAEPARASAGGPHSGSQMYHRDELNRH
jgi:eukaryotic-like serine/threonine-protein kinase